MKSYIVTSFEYGTIKKIVSYSSRAVMLEHSQRRTYKPISLFFVALIVLQGFFTSVLVARGQAEVDWGFQNPTSATVTAPTDPTAKASGGSTTTEASTSTTGCTWSGWPSDILTCVVQSTLLGLRDLMGWLAGGAASLFVWVVDPANVTGPTGMLNKVSVYNLWKFIRDFFNLFFILILLFSAFSTIFQIEAFSIRKVFFNILLAALIINFSFPITRFLIDMTNVPMYYFLNVTVDGTSGGALKITESLLGASGISSVFMGNSNFWQLVMNVIFVFLFAISLLVLAVLMLIRVIALVLLVIFSPIGFAASLLPGTEKLGRDWWNYFWKYAFFGPSAALMLMVSVRFMNEIGNDGTFGSMVSTSTGMSAGAFQSSALAQITFLTIPIILIWSAIGMANSASIAGAGKVTGWGYGAARKVGGWTKRGAWGATKLILPTNVAKGVVAGAKEGLKGGKLFGAPIMPKYISPKAIKQRAEDREAKWKGILKEGTGKNEVAKLEAKRQYEAAKEMKDNNISYSALVDALKGKDSTKAAAAAMVLTDKKAINSAEHLNLAFKALGDNTNELAELINNAGDDAFKFDTTTTTEADKFGNLRAKLSGLDATHGSKLNSKLEEKIKKEGHTKVLIDYELNNTKALASGPISRQVVYDKYLAKMTAKEIAKMQDVHAGPDPEVKTYVNNQVTSGQWGPKDKADFYSELTSAQKSAWYAAGFRP